MKIPTTLIFPHALTFWLAALGLLLAGCAAPDTDNDLNGVEDFTHLPQFSDNYRPPAPRVDPAPSGHSEMSYSETVDWLRRMLPRLVWQDLGTPSSSLHVTAATIEKGQVILYEKSSDSNCYIRTKFALNSVDPHQIGAVKPSHPPGGQKGYEFAFSCNSKGVVTYETINRTKTYGADPTDVRPALSGSRDLFPGYTFSFRTAADAERVRKAFCRLIALSN